MTIWNSVRFRQLFMNSMDFANALKCQFSIFVSTSTFTTRHWLLALWSRDKESAFWKLILFLELGVHVHWCSSLQADCTLYRLGFQPKTTPVQQNQVQPSAFYLGNGCNYPQCFSLWRSLLTYEEMMEKRNWAKSMTSIFRLCPVPRSGLSASGKDLLFQPRTQLSRATLAIFSLLSANGWRWPGPNGSAYGSIPSREWAPSLPQQLLTHKLSSIHRKVPGCGPAAKNCPWLSQESPLRSVSHRSQFTEMNLNAISGSDVIPPRLLSPEVSSHDKLKWHHSPSRPCSIGIMSRHLAAVWILLTPAQYCLRVRICVKCVYPVF